MMEYLRAWTIRILSLFFHTVHVVAEESFRMRTTEVCSWLGSIFSYLLFYTEGEIEFEFWMTDIFFLFFKLCYTALSIELR